MIGYVVPVFFCDMWTIVYFDQLAGAACTQKLVEQLFFEPFSTTNVNFKPFLVQKG